MIIRRKMRVYKRGALRDLGVNDAMLTEWLRLGIAQPDHGYGRGRYRVPIKTAEDVVNVCEKVARAKRVTEQLRDFERPRPPHEPRSPIEHYLKDIEFGAIYGGKPHWLGGNHGY